MSRLLLVAAGFVLAGSLNGCIVMHQVVPEGNGESVLVLASRGLVQSVYSCSGTIGGYECVRLFKARALARASTGGSGWDSDSGTDGRWDTYDRDEDYRTEEELEAARARRSELLERGRTDEDSESVSGESEEFPSEPSDRRAQTIVDLREQLDAAGITDPQVRKNMINGALRSKGLAELEEDEAY